MNPKLKEILNGLCFFLAEKDVLRPASDLLLGLVTWMTPFFDVVCVLNTLLWICL